MKTQWRWAPGILAAVCVSLACNSRPNTSTVTVRIFRDLNSPYAQQLDHRILEFQGSNPRLPNGAAVQVHSVSISDDKNALSNMDDPGVEIVILNSREDAAARLPSLQPELTHAVNICAAVHACPADVPAFVPSKLKPERAQAANQFVQFLVQQKEAQQKEGSQTEPQQK
jgi:hypothetical protein